MSIVQSKIKAINELMDVIRELPQVPPRIKHYFSDGIYAREMTMVKDAIVVGKIHKHKHLNMISKGKCKVVTQLRSMYIEAPFTFESVEGEQKAIYALEELVWTTIHATDETDIAKIEEYCVHENYDEQNALELVKRFGELK